MKKIKMSFTIVAFFSLFPIYVRAQTNSSYVRNIETIGDLKLAIDSSSYQIVMQNMDSWFPKIVSTTNWQNRISPSYMLHYYIDVNDDDDILFDSLAEQSETIFSQLNEFFEMEAITKQEILAQQTRLLCFIIKTQTNATFGFMVNPHTLFFYLDTKQTPDFMEKLRHEYAHWVWGRTYGEAPSLFWEGLATYAEKMSNPGSNTSSLLDTKIDLENIPSLHKIAFNDQFWRHKGMYTVGSLLIHFLVEKWGWEKLKKLFLISHFDDPKISEHFQQIYQQSLETIDFEWRQFIKTELMEKD